MNIEIEIKAAAGAGKTTVSAIIIKALREYGIDVVVEPDIDYATEEDWLGYATDDRIAHIANSKTVNLKQISIPRRAMLLDSQADIAFFEQKIKQARIRVQQEEENQRICTDKAQDADERVNKALDYEHAVIRRLALIQDADISYGLEGI